MAEIDLRCEFCARGPLMGRFVVDGEEAYLHIRSWRQERVKVNAKIHGPVEVQCVNCERWTKVNPRSVRAGWVRS